MESATCPPPNIDAQARLAHERLDRARDAYERAATELDLAERACKRADDAWLHKHYPKFY